MTQEIFPMPWPASLWAETADSLERLASLEGEHIADVAIIGGGYTGLSAAHRFAERNLKPVVLEANEVGWGASGRNGGVVSTKFRVSLLSIAKSHGLAVARRMYDLGHEAVDRVSKLVDEYRIESAGFSLTGNLRCAQNTISLESLTAAAEIMREQFGDRSIHVLGAQEVANETGSKGFVGGVLTTHAGVLHPLNLARGIARGLCRKGVEIFEHSAALAIRDAGDGVLIETAKGILRARRALVATNAYSDLTAATSAIRKTLTPFRSAMLATEPLATSLDRVLLPERRSYSETRCMMRWFRRVDDRMLFGGRGAFGKTDSRSAFEALHRAMVELFPQLEGTAITHRWSGLVGMTLDSVPHVGRLDDRVTYALGYNGTGIAMACLTGRYAADLALGAEPDLALLSAGRLKAVPFYPVREPAVRLVAGWYHTSCHNR